MLYCNCTKLSYLCACFIVTENGLKSASEASKHSVSTNLPVNYRRRQVYPLIPPRFLSDTPPTRAERKSLTRNNAFVVVFMCVQLQNTIFPTWLELVRSPALQCCKSNVFWGKGKVMIFPRNKNTLMEQHHFSPICFTLSFWDFTHKRLTGMRVN